MTDRTAEPRASTAHLAVDDSLLSSAGRASTPSRRRLLVTAAWAAPVIATAVAAPAHAASNVRGIGGWVLVSWNRGHVSLDGRGDPPERGLWVTDTNPGDTITAATITFYIPATIAVTAWTAEGGDSGAWSIPVTDGTTLEVDGVEVRGYVTTFNFAAFPVTPVSPITYLNNDLHFRTENVGFGSALVWARRSVTVNGVVLSFLRGPVSPGNNNRSATPVADELVTGTDQV